ncbi:MAG: TIM barrel protein [Candidatus Brockarchaeota archaeon]|nr:TIM barrel protein [Candidatus Brockarchaeota archaeon]MBO3768701.1 TIM barrel protein [Candidatus Brockarchaeota archaeon]
MNVTKNKLEKLNTEYSGYIEGEKIDKFFEDFGINFAAGHWAAGDFLDRFATKGYNSNDPTFSNDIVSQLKRVKKAGIKGVEFHDVIFIDSSYRINENIVEEVKATIKELSLVPTNMNINLWTDPKWKLGGLTNPSKKVREEALQIALQAIEIAKKVGCRSVALWPGADGWDYNFEVNYGKQLELFVEGCETISKEAKKTGLIFGVEAKLHEPREGNMVIPTTHLSALVAKTVNERTNSKNMGVCIDYGHEQMYAVEPAATVYALKQFDVPLVNFHINTAKLHSNDEDRVFGTGDIWRMVDFIYAAIDTNYNGWFGEDQFTYRVDPVKAMYLSKEIFANLAKKALLIYSKKEELERVRESGDQAEVINFVKKIILSS